MGGARSAAVRHQAQLTRNNFQYAVYRPLSKSRAFSCPAITGANPTQSRMDHRQAKAMFRTLLVAPLMRPIVTGFASPRDRRDEPTRMLRERTSVRCQISLQSTPVRFAAYLLLRPSRVEAHAQWKAASRSSRVGRSLISARHCAALPGPLSSGRFHRELLAIVSRLVDYAFAHVVIYSIN